MHSPRVEAAPERDVALDYVRALALLLMAWVHIWRFYIGTSGIDGAVLFLGEAAPFYFFFAFGMTQTRFVRRPLQKICGDLLLFGCVGVLHNYSLLMCTVWEFLFFLWVASIALVLLHRLGIDRRGAGWLAAAILLINVFVPLGASVFHGAALLPQGVAVWLWLRPGPFFLLPWLVVVLAGFAIGMHAQLRRRDIAVAIVAMVVSLGAGVLAAARPQLPWADRLALSKWAATSPYVLLGTAMVVLVYAALRAVPITALQRPIVYRPVRFFSEYLLIGTVLHYQVTDLLVMHNLFTWRSLAGVRSMSVGGVALVSLLDLALLAVLIQVAVWLWQPIARRTAALQRRLLPTVVLTAATVGWLAFVEHWRGRVTPSSMHWMVYGAWVLVSLYYAGGRWRVAARTPAVARDAVTAAPVAGAEASLAR